MSRLSSSRSRSPRQSGVHSRLPSSSSAPLSPSPPSQTYHPGPILLPTTTLIDSVAGGAHYSGATVDSPEIAAIHRRSALSPDKHGSEGSVTDLSPSHRRIRDDLNEMFGGRTTLEILNRSWSKDAVFEDPLSHCHGYAEYAAQWFGLNKLFSKSVTLSSRTMLSSHSPNRLVYAQKQEYTFRWIGWKKVIDSIVVVDLNEEDKVVKLVDQWDGKELPSRYGAYWLRRTNAKVAPWLVRVPKESQ